LKRVIIVEKRKPGKINKVVKHCKALRKELRPGEVNEGKEEKLMKMRRQEILENKRLSEKEAHRERSPQEGGKYKKSVEAREYQAVMDLREEREYSTLILEKIGSPTEDTSPEDENETPQIKETHPKASGTSLESLVPQVSSIIAVNSVIPYAIAIPIQSIS
jgi:hypothetical protein